MWQMLIILLQGALEGAEDKHLEKSQEVIQVAKVE